MDVWGCPKGVCLCGQKVCLFKKDKQIIAHKVKATFNTSETECYVIIICMYRIERGMIIVGDYE